MVQCCDVLNGKILNQDKNGFSVYNDERYFYLKFLAVDKNEIDNLVKALKKNDYDSNLLNIKISGKVVIKFCPFCGEKIK